MILQALEEKKGARARAMTRQVASPEWSVGMRESETPKGNGCSLAHAAAVAECAELSERYRRMWHRRAAGMVDINTILQALRAKKVPFVLTGAHGISGWTGLPRSTKDVDILVKSGRNHARAVKVLRALYPSLEVRLVFGVTAFFLPGEKHSLIDVTYPHRADIEETLKTAIWVEKEGNRYRIPTLEAALANKYGAMLALSRPPLKRAQDMVDFGLMVAHSTEEGQQPIDLERLLLLGEKVWPGGGGAEILRLVEEVKQGKVPSLNPLDRPQP